MKTLMTTAAIVLLALPAAAFTPSAPCYKQADHGNYWFRTFAADCTYAVETAGNRDPAKDPEKDDGSDAGDTGAGDAGDTGSDAAPK